MQSSTLNRCAIRIFWKYTEYHSIHRCMSKHKDIVQGGRAREQEKNGNKQTNVHNSATCQGSVPSNSGVEVGTPVAVTPASAGVAIGIGMR